MQKKIALFVASVHLIMIFMLCFSPVKKNPTPKKHIAVRTIQPKTQSKTRTATAATPRAIKKAAASESGAAAPKPKAAPKKEAKAKTPQTAAAKQAAVKSKPIQQKKPAMVEKGKPKKPKAKAPDKVWKEIDEALAKIDDKVYSKSQSKLDVPQMKGSSSSKIPFPDMREIEEEGTDEESLVSFLHTSLNLPEYGEVKIQLTIRKDGSVARLVVVEAQNQKNKAYLEKHLPLLRFPLILDKEKTFTFTFCNEI
jgi:type IV secretory pathway VirB10-like protein